MRKSDSFTVMFAALVCLVCSLLLALTTAGLKPRQDAAIELDRKFNILKAFQVPVVDARNQKIPAAETLRLYKQHVREVVVDAASGALVEGQTPATVEASRLAKYELLPLFLWEENGAVSRYAFPIAGKGLWSTIYGYLALDRDLATVLGITFYKDGETPGLGGEINQPWFQEQFKGKVVFKDGRPQKLEIVKGLVKDKYPDGSDRAVDGISGATLTGKGMNDFINRDLARYEPYFKTIRGQ
jgi:Na+-transporting NADH:ubiquinone oxidoreductase subunit C